MKFDFFSRKKFKCDICKEKFKTETELRQHKNLHTYTLHAYTHIHYRRLADLVRNGLIIRKDGSRKYILSSLGKVVYSNLLSIQYIVDNIWKFKAIDAIEVCDDEIYKDIGKISNGLVDTLAHKEHIKAILKDMI